MACPRLVGTRSPPASWAICPITELELLHASRSKVDREEWLELLNATFAWVALPDRVFGRATEVETAITAHGTHRSAGA